MGIKFTLTTIRPTEDTPFWTLADNANDDLELKRQRSILDGLIFDRVVSIDILFPDVNTQTIIMRVHDVERFTDAYDGNYPRTPDANLLAYNEAHGIITIHSEEEF